MSSMDSAVTVPPEAEDAAWSSIDMASLMAPSDMDAISVRASSSAFMFSSLHMYLSLDTMASVVILLKSNL